MKKQKILQKQVKNLNTFIQGIESFRGPVMLGGVPFFLADLKRLANDMKLTGAYVALDVESLRRENKHLKGLVG